ncbi:TnpV protein [Paenibacillus sp. IHB B 3084]
MAEHEGVTEQLEAQEQMLWVQQMNSIYVRATDIINHNLIYS